MRHGYRVAASELDHEREREEGGEGARTEVQACAQGLSHLPVNSAR